MINFKKSRYNIFVQYREGEHIIFNPISGALGKFDSATMKRYTNDSLTPEEINKLIEKGIYVPNFVNEIDQINKDRIEGIYKNNKHFRIWTTSACNANCYYCFENGIPQINMSKDTADETFDFLNSMVIEGDHISIEWFGGEPLLNVNIIEYLSSKFKQTFEEKGIKWHASVISNGSLLTKHIIEKCASEWNIRNFQITLDGYNNEYNRIKNYHDIYKYNFDNVICNIKMLVKNGINVNIRMNYDTANYDTLKTLIKFMHQNFYKEKYIKYYIYPVWDALGDRKDHFVSKAKADEQMIDLMKMLIDYKMADIRSLCRLRYRKHQCSACNIYGFSILPNGDLLKCSEAFNSVVGNVSTGLKEDYLALKWTDVGIDDECKECIYLPLCQGGCRASKATRMPKCIAYKEIIPQLLIMNVEYLERECKGSS